MYNKSATFIIASALLFSLNYIFLIHFAANIFMPNSMNDYGKYTQIPLIVIPFIGFIYGLYTYLKSNLKNVYLKKSILFFSTSLLFWSLGMASWAIYIFSLKLESVPYPSAGDFFFMFIEPIAYIGIFYLMRTISVDITKNFSSTIRFLIVPITLLLCTIFLLNYLSSQFANKYSGNIYQVFFNYYYPIVTTLSIGFLTSLFIVKLKTKNLNLKIILAVFLLGQVLQYCGDIWYSVSNITGNYFNGYWPDLFYVLSLAITSVSVVNLPHFVNNNKS